MLIDGVGECIRNRILILRSFAAMARTEERALAIIAERARYRRFSAGQSLLAADRASDVVYFLIEGLVKSRLGQREVRVAHGHGVGLLAALCRDESGTDATAISDCVALEVPTEDFLRAHESSITMLRTSLRILASDLLFEHGGLPRAGSEFPEARAGVDAAPRDFARRLLGAQHTMVGRTSLLAAMDAVALSQPVTIAKGETVWIRGARADAVLTLDSGTIRCSSPSGRSVDVAGTTTLGQLELVSGQQCSYDALALTELHGYRIAEDDFFALLETHPKVGMRLLTTVARQLRAQGTPLPNEGNLL